MLTLRSSKKIQKDLKNYKKSIENIKNANIKEHAKSLLLKLQSELIFIDEFHNSSNKKSIDLRTTRDNIKRSVEIRLELDQIIKDSR